MKHLFIMLVFSGIAGFSFAQTNIFPATGSAGIGTTVPNASSILEMVSTTKGLLIPRMTLTQRNAIVAPAPGLMIYQTSSTQGFYYYSGSAWTAITPAAGANKTLSNLTSPTAINASMIPGTTNTFNLGSSSFAWNNLYLGNRLYMGAFPFLANKGIDNSFAGNYAGYNNSKGKGNSFFGSYAGWLNLGDSSSPNTPGCFNSFYGTRSGYNNGLGKENSFFGNLAGYYNNSGSDNVFLGSSAGYNNSAGDGNIAVGKWALHNNTSSSLNIAIGSFALVNNSSGPNLAIGYYALAANTAGSGNIALGDNAMTFNTTGVNNIGIGSSALNNIANGSNNVAIGIKAQSGFGTIGNGSNNVAVGFYSMYYPGFNNTAVGTAALYGAINANFSSGSFNAAVGDSALYNNNGASNVAMGSSAGYSNVSGGANCFLGWHAGLLSRGNDNVIIGYDAGHFTLLGGENCFVGSYAGRTNVSGTRNTYIGRQADATAAGLTNSIALGYGASVNASLKAVIGNSTVNVIGGSVGWSILSDGRFKKDIKENVPGLAFINKLRPVTYHTELRKFEKFLGKTDSILNTMKSEFDLGERKIRTGFVAQEVEKAAKEINYDFDGVNAPQNEKDNYSLVYADFVPSLVKAVQELSKANEELHETVISQQQQIDELKAMFQAGNNLNRSSSNSQLSVASLDQNIPNPFTHTTTINYTLPQSRQGGTTAQIVITDKNGKTIKSVNISGSGNGTLQVDASTLASGAYSYSLYVDGKMIDSKQMILAK